MEQVMLGKVATLREQMVSAASLEDGEAEGEQPGPMRRFKGRPMR